MVGPVGANLFIYDVPLSFTESDLMSLFSPFGKIVSTKIYRDRKTGKSRGFGFVSFDNVDSADVAIQKMDGYEIESKVLQVQKKIIKQNNNSKEFYVCLRIVGSHVLGSEVREGTEMQKVIIPRQLQEVSRVIFGNLPANSLVSTGLKAFSKKPTARPLQVANPRSIQEILRAPLVYPTDDLILNGYKPYEWLRYTELTTDIFAKKMAGELVDEEELFYYRRAKPRRIVDGHVASMYKTDNDDYWEKKALRRRFQGKGPPKKGDGKRKSK